MSNAVDAQRHAIGIAEDLGLYLEFESSAGFELVLQSLDRRKDGLELVAVRRQLDVMFATVFVAPGKLETLERLIRQYRDVDDSCWNQPKNRRLVESYVREVDAAERAQGVTQVQHAVAAWVVETFPCSW